MRKNSVVFWGMVVTTWRQTRRAQDAHSIQGLNAVSGEIKSTDIAPLFFHPGKQDIEKLLHFGYQHFQCNACADSDRTPEWNFPKLFILGAQKGGTTAIRGYLGEHPDVFGGFHHEVHFFDKTLDFPIAAFGDNHTDKCPALEQYKDHLLKLIGKGYPKNKKKIVIDKTPEYLVRSHELPQRTLCLFPEAKFVVVLRNPVDRAYSHYNHRKRRAGRKRADLPDFADFVEKEHRSLIASGVLNETLTPAEESVMWTNIQRHGNKYGVIARGLYAPQLRQWMSVLYDHFGAEKMWDHLLILESERAKENKQAYFDRMLHFAEMEPHELKNQKDGHVGVYDPMSDVAKQRLEELFRPQNKKLHDLLSPFGIEISWAKAAAESYISATE
jgi:hypothetical protein